MQRRSEKFYTWKPPSEGVQNVKRAGYTQRKDWPMAGGADIDNDLICNYNRGAVDTAHGMATR